MHASTAGFLSPLRRWSLATIALCVLALNAPRAPAQIHGACSRCADSVKLSDQGAGLDRDWQGLCGACQDPRRRCEQAVEDLQRRYDAERDRLGHMRVSFAEMQAARGGLSDEEAAMYRELVLEPQEALVDELRQRLERMRAECAAGPTSGTSGEAGRPRRRPAAEAADDLLQRVLGASLGTAQRVLDGASSGGPGQSSANLESAQNKSFEADYLEATLQYARSVVSAATAPVATPLDARSQPLAAQEEVVSPRLLDAYADLPPLWPARQFTAWHRHSTNAAAYAQALRDTAEQVELARASGERERADKHAAWALYLAAAGQKTLRKATEERLLGMRALYTRMTTFRNNAQVHGTTVEKTLAAWQTEVRGNGLPGDYLEALRQCGMSEAEIVQRREWLQNADLQEAAKAHSGFVDGVAARYLPEASKAGGVPQPEADDLWDEAALALLRDRDPPATASADAPVSGPFPPWILLLSGLLGLAALALIVGYARKRRQPRTDAGM